MEKRTNGEDKGRREERREEEGGEKAGGGTEWRRGDKAGRSEGGGIKRGGKEFVEKGEGEIWMGEEGEGEGQ